MVTGDFRHARVMLQTVVDLAAQYAWYAVALTAAAGVVAFIAWEWLRLRRGYSRIKTALNNMSQGLCMWSPGGKLLLCNERYIQMYDLSPELARRGASLRELLEQRR